jgi:hypothetical protein
MQSQQLYRVRRKNFEETETFSFLATICQTLSQSVKRVYRLASKERGISKSKIEGAPCFMLTDNTP